MTILKTNRVHKPNATAVPASSPARADLAMSPKSLRMTGLQAILPGQVLSRASRVRGLTLTAASRLDLETRLDLA